MSSIYIWKFNLEKNSLDFICRANNVEEARKTSLQLIKEMKIAEIEYNDTIIQLRSLEKLSDHLGWSDDIDPIVDKLLHIIQKFPILDSKANFSVFTQSNLENIIKTKNPKEKED